jgi:hypothetical protein
MPSVAELLLSVKGKDDGASKVLDDIDKKAGGVGGTLKNLGTVAGGFVLGAGLLKAPDFLKSAAEAASEDEASTNRLKNAINNTGDSYDEISGVIEDVIKSGQRLGFTDDQTRDSLSLLAAQTGDSAEAVKRYALAQDLARGANIDVVTASKLLGKVTDENVNVLARYGIKVEKGASETELFAAVYGKFHGQAQTFADSTAGKMARLSDQMGELKESIGYAVLPVMSALGTIAEDALIPALSKAAEFAITLGRAAVDYIGIPFDKIGEIVRRVISVFSDFGNVLADPAVAIQEGIGLTGQWGDVLTDVIVFIRDQVIPTLQSIGAGIGVVGDQVKAIIVSIADWANENNLLNTALIGMETIWQGLQIAAQALWPLLKQVADFMVENKIAAYALVAGLAILIVSFATLPVIIAAIALAVGALVQHWDDIKAKAIEVWNSIPGPIKAALDAIYATVSARIAGVIQVFQGMYQTVTGIVDLVVDLFHGRWSQAWDDLKRIASGVIETLLGFLRAEFGQIPDIILGAAGAAASAAVTFGRGIADGIASGIKAGVNFIIGAVNKVLDFVRGIHISIPSVDIPKIGKVGGGTIDIPGVPGSITPLARGTSYFGGGLAMVGENGPELAWLPRGSAVAPTGQGFGGGIHVHLEGSMIYGVDDFDARVRKAVREGVGAGAFRGVL